MWIEGPAARERRRRRPGWQCVRQRVLLRGLERGIDAHLSREVGHHAVESGDCNGVAPS